jgi:hypothetical protein
VQVCSSPFNGLPRSAKVKAIKAAGGLASGLMSETEVAAFVSAGRLDCVIVGNRNLLREEIVEAPFATKASDGTRIEGTLQDVLRVRGFTADAQIGRCEVFSINSRLKPLHETAPVVIFDGCKSFLNFRSFWPSSHWLLVLDRADRRFDEAAATFNELYVYRENDNPGLVMQPPPTGVECAVMSLPKGRL